MSERDPLIASGVDPEALDWLGDLTFADAWHVCERGDWLLWWAARCPAFTAGGALHHEMVLASCEIARTALVYVMAGEGRPLAAIETAEAWTRGDTTIEQAQTAAWAAHLAADAADASAEAAADATTAAAARAAQMAASAVGTATVAEATAAIVVEASVWAALAASTEASRASADAHRSHAAIVRRHIAATEVASVAPLGTDPTGPVFRLTIVDRSDDRVRLRYEWGHGIGLMYDPVVVWHLGIGALIDARHDEPTWLTACRHVRGLTLEHATGVALDDFESHLGRIGEGLAVAEFRLRVHDASALDHLAPGATYDLPPPPIQPGVWRLRGMEQGQVQDVSIELVNGRLVVSTTTLGGPPKLKRQHFSKSLDGALTRARTVRELIAKGFHAAPEDAG